MGVYSVVGGLELHEMRSLIAYIEHLEITQGRFAGQAFRVLPWESRFVRGAFKPGVETSALSIARANGKTSLVAAVASATVDGPLMVPRGETVICASSFEQARIAFEHVRGFMGEKLESKRYRVWDTAQQARIEDRETGARVRCIGSDPRRAHGLAPTLLLLDEPAQWPPSTGEAMLAALTTASGKQPFCRTVALGTRPASANHWFASWLGGGADYSQSHEASLDDPKFQKRTWVKANPSLRFMPDLEDAIRRHSERARKDAAQLASFDALRLNLGTSDVRENVLLEASTWQSIEGEAEMRGRPIWGVDLGATAAMSAIAGYWPETGRLDVISAFPTEPDLRDRGLRDGVGDLYVQGWKRGELLTLGGATVDVAELVREALLRFGAPRAIAADRWREGELRDALKAVGVPVAALELRGQGFKDGAEDVRSFRTAALEGRLKPTPSLVLTAAISEARTVADPAGNEKLAKSSQGGRRLRAKDDAAAAGILAVAVGSRKHAGSRRNGVYLGKIG